MIKNLSEADKFARKCFKKFLLLLTGVILLNQNLIYCQGDNLSDSLQTGWIKQYISGYTPAFDFSYAVDVDHLGNIYVTGSSYGADTSADYVTIKYNSSGDTQWVRRYNGPGNNWDIAYALTVDASGSAYITGKTYDTNSNFDCATIKYNTMGVQQWVAIYNGPENSEDVALDIVVDGLGNVYVSGQTSGTGTFYDYLTIKYNAGGIQQWAVSYNGPGNTADHGKALDVDLSGNVYVTGDSGEGSPNSSDYVTVKYNSSGVEQWVARYSSLFDYATAITVDGSGNVYVSGYSFSIGTYYDYATIKYNSSGIEQWVSRYHGGNSDDIVNAIALDNFGNVYVTGESGGSGTFGDYATVKYNSSGAEQWAARYNGPGNSSDRAVALAIDGSGNVYVTGESEGSGSKTDFATVKYNSSGVEQCVTRYNSQGDHFDLAADIAVDVSGNVCVSGRVNQLGGSIITTIRYVQVPVSAHGQNTEILSAFSLQQNYPNPFNPVTTITFALPESGIVELKVYDILGRETAVLLNSYMAAGFYTQRFDASDMTSGLYYYTLKTNGFTETKKMLLVK